MMKSTADVPDGWVMPVASTMNEHEISSTTTVAPATRAERISSIDVLRGFALLGILVMNIDSFGDVQAAHDIPFGTSLGTFAGSYAHWNLALFYIKWLFFEGKMRAMFSMLFGAGVVLLTSRAEKRGAGGMAADIYTRRNIVLVLFGLIHGCFIWEGDILFDYGLVALLLLYPLRKARPRVLLALVAISSLLSTFSYESYFHIAQNMLLSRQAAAVATKEQRHQPVSAAERSVQKAWQGVIDTHRLQTREEINKEVEKKREQGYWEGVDQRLDRYIGTSVSFHIFLMPDILAPALLGIALFQLGFLTAELSTATYVWTAVIGFSISVPLVIVGVYRTYAHGCFFFLNNDEWLTLPYDLQRLTGMVAITAVVMILIKLGALRRTQRLLAAVGKMALTNYLLASVLCQFFFIWGPWKLFGTLQYCQLMYVVFAVWAVNITLSSLWLRCFQFGPLEWVWRSATYGKFQPMLQPAPGSVSRGGTPRPTLHTSSRGCIK
jgi:uncharacterized protein